jgi:dephospho-CoA kinase
MHLIGILGGVASGKSLVAGQFARLGAGVLDADRAGHEVLRLPHVETAVRQRWGAEVFGPDGRVDRSRLACIVFGDPPDGPRERKYLEQLTHPEIGRLLERQAERLAASGCRAAVLDAALLMEAGWDRLCEKLVFVDAPRELRLSRALARGWNEEDFAAREQSQRSLDWKRGRADVVLDNSGSPEQTLAQVERLWQSLIG